MPLPHYTQLENTGSPAGPGSSPEEVVYLNLFEITFVLPKLLEVNSTYAGDKTLLLENATKIDLTKLTDFGVGVEKQRFKYSTRAFLTTPTETHGEISIPFQVNVSNTGTMNVWNVLKAWYDLVFNSQNGELHYKADIIGTIVVNQHDKKGVILRRVTFQNCQLKALDGYTLDWSSANIMDQVNATFVYDFFIDEYIDGEFAVSNSTNLYDDEPSDGV
jgi:hypothetical protein